eukprot:TRINITY_DN1403_c2_g1_i1.p1 TRINITY_DN1403_c2_g1~~TRINITY_DN1403_c2_g1_i1.p1  ORF type:complete len:750 (+),score=268.71 TRINITY_DN1403_c2_g1_i1:63-2312(+)
MHRAAFALAAAAAATAQRLELQVADDASFTVTHDGQPWLAGAEVQVAGLSKAQGTLAVAAGPVRGSGADALGAYTSTTFRWAAAGGDGAVLLETTFRTYAADAGAIVFEQTFPTALGPDARARGDGLLARTIFPGFARGAGQRDLDAMAYHGTFPSAKAATLGTYKATHQGGSPLMLYDSKNASLPMTVFAPLTFPKAQHMASADGFVGAGVKATAEVIPAGHSQLFILSAGAGVNAGFLAWGDRALKYAGKGRADMYRDDVHAKIGFWTDNGGYYHYATGAANATYEAVLPQVKASHDELGVPFGHWQFDSWFYPKDGKVAPGGGGGAVTNWTAMDGTNGPFVFTSMAHIQQLLSKNTTGGAMPMVMHNRQWSPESDYIHNWTDIQWYKSAKAAIPHDPHKFFQRFFTTMEGWGLSMYEQDWMDFEYDNVEALQTNLTLADMWLAGMAEGAAGGPVARTVQYCMPYPNDVLAAQAHAAVTNARATNDYFHAAEQWALGATSLFYWAIGVLPFKDGFYSSSLKQIGGQTVGPELNPDREALMATLSCAMVGPMDGIHLLNASRVMTTCRADGVVLKPDKPVATVDWCFAQADPTCTVYATHSDVPGLGAPVQYWYSDEARPLLRGMLPLKSGAAYALYNWYTGATSALEDSTDVAVGYEGHAYAVATPVLHGKWAVLGETAKYVPLSTKRFVSVDAGAQHVTVTVRGTAGETMRWCAAVAAGHGFETRCRSVTFPAGAGDLTVTDTLQA